MKGTGNSFSVLFQKLRFMCLPTQKQRSKYITKHKKQFEHIGSDIFWQSRKFPADPEFLHIGNNVKISANVIFVGHDATHHMLNRKYATNEFKPKRGCIYVSDNVMIGANVIILPNVYIGENVVIGAGAVITKDIPSNSVVAGIPGKVIGTFDDFVEKRKQISITEREQLWYEFYQRRGLKTK